MRSTLMKLLEDLGEDIPAFFDGGGMEYKWEAYDNLGPDLSFLADACVEEAGRMIIKNRNRIAKKVIKEAYDKAKKQEDKP